MHPSVHCSTIYHSQDMEATFVCSSAGEWIKTGYINGILIIKKNRKPSAVTCMDLEIIILSEVNQTDKDKYHMISLIPGI